MLTGDWLCAAAALVGELLLEAVRAERLLSACHEVVADDLVAPGTLEIHHAHVDHLQCTPTTGYTRDYSSHTMCCPTPAQQPQQPLVAMQL